MTCGVCISHSRLRSSVLLMLKSALPSLMVALHFTANTAAPCSMASAQQRRVSSMLTSGRALSWMAASAAPSRSAARQGAYTRSHFRST